MNKDDVIANMCRLAVNWKTVGDMSINDWMTKSGWPTMKKCISVEDIKMFLRSEPALVDRWMSYSEDKRCPGPSFGTSEMPGYYSVYLGLNEGVKKYRDRIEACAVFIMKEFNSFSSKTCVGLRGDVCADL